MTDKDGRLRPAALARRVRRTGGASGGAPPPDARRTAAILARYPRRDPGELVNILHDLQAEFRYLPEDGAAAGGRSTSACRARRSTAW